MVDTRYQNIPIDCIVEPVNQIRTVIVLEGLQELANSIKEKGIIQPLVVWENGERYEISAGHRRYLAAKIVGLGVLPCIIRKGDKKDADIIKLHENYFREDINPVDEGKFFVKVHTEQGLSYAEIARLCVRSDSYVINRVNLLQGDESILAALEAGQLNFSQAIEIARAQDPGVRFELLRITIESGATVETLRMMRHDYARRIDNQNPDGGAAPPPGGSYPDLKHLIVCPCCNGSYPVSSIYPISVCKTCYDNFLSSLKDTAKGEGD